MRARIVQQLVAACACCFWSACQPAIAEEAIATQPNIVFIIADDCTFRDLGCYGGQAHTPNIDKLASEGMLFERCFQAAPMCSPTRHNIYTGLYPVKSGAYPNHTHVDAGTKSIVQYMTELGYQVAHTGKSHVSPASVFSWQHFGTDKEFDYGAIDKWIADCKTDANPFCLLHCSNEPHAPWDKGDASRYPPEEITLPPYFVDTPETREGMSRYLAEITYFDQQVGDSLALLEKNGVSDNTLVMVVSEQGSSMPFAKWTCYDHGLQSACLVRWPGKVEPGSVNPAMIEYVDFLPTFIEAAGGKVDPNLDGRSLIEVLNGKQTHKEFVFGEMTTRGIHSGSDFFGIRSVRSEKFKYIWNFTPDVEFKNLCTESVEFKSWIRAAKNGNEKADELVSRYQFRPEVELYNIVDDPMELNNLADNEDYASVKDELRSKLDAWMQRCGDKGQATELKALERMGAKRWNNVAKPPKKKKLTSASKESNSDRPNVLLVYIDDLKPMTRDYGHDHMHTPNFDRLAKRGMRFENAYCQVPTCGASRASLMTGLYPTRNRFPDFKCWAEKEAPDVKTLPQRFREAGYVTISNGKVFHHKRDTEDRSWSEPAWRPKTSGTTTHNPETAAFLETSTETRQQAGRGQVKKTVMFEKSRVAALNSHDGRIAKKTMDDLERLAGSDQPFFIACGFAKPHMPFYSPAPTWKPYPISSIEIAEHRERPIGIPNAARIANEQDAYVPMNHDLTKRLEYNSDLYHKFMRQGYYASVTHADDLLGRLLDKLDELDLSDNTYIVVIGDHGWLLGEHNQWAKNVLLHEALRTAMWISGPGVQPDSAAKTFVEFVDIHPTLCELAQIEFANNSVNGKSFVELFQAPSAIHREHAYTKFQRGDAITSADYQYVRWTLDDGSQESLLIDRQKDPLAKVNVSGKSEYELDEANLENAVAERIRAASRFEFRPVSE